VVDLRIINGEKHYVVKILDCDENPANCKDFDKIEIKKIMKKEASEPLLLLRVE